jgi:hypothetical protein
VPFPRGFKSLLLVSKDFQVLTIKSYFENNKFFIPSVESVDFFFHESIYGLGYGIHSPRAHPRKISFKIPLDLGSIYKNLTTSLAGQKSGGMLWSDHTLWSGIFGNCAPAIAKFVQAREESHAYFLPPSPPEIFKTPRPMWRKRILILNTLTNGVSEERQAAVLVGLASFAKVLWDMGVYLIIKKSSNCYVDSPSSREMLNRKYPRYNKEDFALTGIWPNKVKLTVEWHSKDQAKAHEVERREKGVKDASDFTDFYELVSTKEGAEATVFRTIE